MRMSNARVPAAFNEGAQFLLQGREEVGDPRVRFVGGGHSGLEQEVLRAQTPGL